MSDAKPVDLAAIRARADAATPGPLRPGAFETWNVYAPYADALEGPNGERVLLRMNHHFEHKADALFFAHARTDVPAMADRIEALEAGLLLAIRALTEADGAGLFTETNARLRALLPPS